MSHGYEVLAKRIAEVCDGRIFGLMGDGNMTMLASLIESAQVTYYPVRHEATAVSMAAGFARATGGLGICTVTHGPGFTNALTALDAAAKDQTPLVLVVGELPVGETEHDQRVDHAAVASAVSVHSMQVTAAGQIPAAVAEAAMYARTHRAPVVLQVAYEALMEDVEMLAALQSAHEPAAADAQAPDDAALSRAAELLKGARRPFIVAGRGVVLSGTEGLVGDLATRVGAVLATTLGAVGACGRQERTVGLVGGFAHPRVAAVAEDSDVVLALGAGLNDFTTSHGQLFAGARIVHADVSQRAIGRYRPVEVALLGDLRVTLPALLDRLGDQPADAGHDLDSVKQVAAAAREWDLVDRSDAAGVDPRTVVTRFSAAFPADRAVVIDGGHLIEWSARYLAPGDARYWLPSLGAGSIGLSTSTGMGVAVGSGRPTVVVVGDGSFMMSLNDVDVAVRCRLPVCFLVINDRAYGAEVHKLRRYGLQPVACDFVTPSLAEVATALGARSMTLLTTDDLDRLDELDWDLALAEGPVLIDAVVTPNVVSSRLAS